MDYTRFPPHELDPYKLSDEVRLHHDRACEIGTDIDQLVKLVEQERRKSRLIGDGFFVRCSNEKEIAALQKKLAQLHEQYKQEQRLEREAFDRFCRENEEYKEALRRHTEQARANAAALVRGY